MSQAAAPPSLWPERFTTPWLALLVGIGALSFVTGIFDPTPGLANVFMKEQDLPVAAATALFLLALRFTPAGEAALGRLAGIKVSARGAMIAAAALTALIAAVGWFLVMRGYPLSTDEFMAGFDAAIFREGRHLAVAPPEWRSLRYPLQPQYILLAADGQSWTSAYLPLNAAVLALFDRLGSQALAGALWTVIAVVALYGVARRLWPERTQPALICVLLLATSSQFLLAGMTRYAMPAHLALNLAWLWLFLRRDRLGDLSAVAVGFAACGLHQVVFHPLFSLPFVLELWLARQWRRAAFYTAAYLAMGLFWIAYWRIFYPSGQGATASDTRDVVLYQLRYVFDHFNAHAFSGLSKNLLRFLTWQNPAAPALAALGLVPALKLGQPYRPMIVGVALLLAVMLVLVPDQGHGWGYRYLHPFLGSVCLLATLGWVKAAEPMDPAQARAAGAGLAIAAVFSLLVLLPWRAGQANAFVRPYAEAAAAIRGASDVDVVAVDATGMFYAADLVRNDPFLRNRPKVVDLVVMRESHVRDMCSRFKVAVFDQLSGAELRKVVYPRRNLVRLAENRALMRELGCGDRRVMVRP